MPRPGRGGGRSGVGEVRLPVTELVTDRPTRAHRDDQFPRHDLEAMVAQLRTAGETVHVGPERYPYGRFAEVHDPEGNGVQLWQPMGAE